MFSPERTVRGLEYTSRGLEYAIYGLEYTTCKLESVQYITTLILKTLEYDREKSMYSPGY
jgi:hypothetical protein